MAVFKRFRSSQQARPAAELAATRRRPLQADGGLPARGAPGTMFSYYSQRVRTQLNTGRRETLESAPAVRRGPVAAIVRSRVVAASLLVVLLAATGYFMTLTTQPRILLLQDEATAYFLQADEVYRQTAEQSLAQSLLNRNKLTIDTAAVRADLLKNYPEIKNVSVALPIFGHQPQVYIEPYKPSFILTTTASNAFLLDSTGRALVSTSQIPDIERLRVLTLQDKTGAEVKLGSRAVASSTISFVQTVVAALQAKDVAIASLSLPPAAYELDVAIAGQPYFVKFNLENDALQQAGTYLAVRQRLLAEKVTPAQYIDVRVPERAYYK